MPKLIKTIIDSLPTKEKSYMVFDDRLKGFGVRVMPSGTKTFQVQYKHHRRTRRKSLGSHGKVTVEEARSEARKLLSAAARSEDPVGRISEMRRSPTVAEHAEQYLERHVAKHCKPRTGFDYRSNLRRLILPRIGEMKLAEVTRQDIAGLHSELSHTPVQANRSLAILSKMFNLAEVWGLRPDGSNPCRHIKKFSETKRERYLSKEELQRLGAVLDAAMIDGSETTHVIVAFRLLIFTGCRLREIERLEWSAVGERHLALRDSKTGPRRVPLPPVARELLDAHRSRTSGRFVIEGKTPGRHITDLEKPWQRVRAKAGLDDVRLHDLRHTYGATAAQNEVSLLILGRIMGHRSTATTARYAHLNDTPVQNAADEVASLLADTLSGN